jgi:hypothetical protein
MIRDRRPELVCIPTLPFFWTAPNHIHLLLPATLRLYSLWLAKMDDDDTQGRIEPANGFFIGWTPFLFGIVRSVLYSKYDTVFTVSPWHFVR